MKLKKNIAISDTGFIFNPTTGDSYSANEIGLHIVKMLQEQNNREEIIAELLAIYKSDKSTIEKDVDDFVTMLTSYKLMTNE